MNRAQDEFEKWYLIEYLSLSNPCDRQIFERRINEFNNLPPEQQWGVKLLFYDSLYIAVECVTIHRGAFGWNIEDYDKVTICSYEDILDTRPEAQTEALEKAEDILNNRLKE